MFERNWTKYLEAEILPEMIEWGPLCITYLFQDKSGASFNPKLNTFFSWYVFFCANAKLFFNFLNIFGPQKVEKNTPKSCLLMAVFSLQPRLPKNSPELHFCFINSLIQPSTISGRISASQHDGLRITQK